MKITAGMGCLDEYVDYVKEGVDEVFCGFVPRKWNEKYLNLLPLNRREVLFYNIQIGTFSDMKRLSKLVKEFKVPVSITFNSLYYAKSQYEEIAGYISRLMELGFYDYIIADMAFLLYLRSIKQIADCIRIHISGEMFEFNRLNILELEKQFGNMISRYIFPRKNTISDMKLCIDAVTKERCRPGLKRQAEFEAFVLNEKCHLSGSFCNSLHCDELCHMCLVPYEFSGDSADEKSFEQGSELLEGESYQVGSSGCGLCALDELRRAGITHLKLVGRGKRRKDMERDILTLKKALQIFENSKSSLDYKRDMKQKLFDNKCSGNCYYYE